MKKYSVQFVSDTGKSRLHFLYAVQPGRVVADMAGSQSRTLTLMPAWIMLAKRVCRFMRIIVCSKRSLKKIVA